MLHIIGGEFRNRKLRSPRGDQTRPTSGRVRETVFNLCQNIVEGSCFLDLFAGSGAVGLEALSRGAEKVILVESHPLAYRACVENIELLKVQSFVTLLKIDVFKALEKLKNHPSPVQMIFADPPYQTIWPGDKNRTMWYSERVVTWVDENSLLEQGGILLVEESDHLRLDIAKRMLDYGVYAPTVYFPLIVKECMLVEPTESESKDTLDHFIEIMGLILEEISTHPHLVLTAPHHQVVGRLDEVQAAKNLILTQKRE